jgi:hypothetical protein
MTVRRVAEVMGEAGGVDQVWVAAKRSTQLTPHLRALQRVGQAGPRHGDTRAPRLDHLRLAGEAAQRTGVQDAGPVALESRTALSLAVFGNPPGARVVVVRHHRAA